MTTATDTPFWSDDFDMDLPKIFPDARRLLGDLADVELVTSGTPCGKTGRLNLPCCWNSHDGMLAFFGFGNPGRDVGFYVAPRAIDIRCTAWEAFRDAWTHSYIMIVDQQRVWDTGRLWPQFETIMYDVRGGPNLCNRDVARARHVAMNSYSKAVLAFGRIVERHRAGRTMFARQAEAR